MSRRGFLVIADITGYTRFLTGSELDHAQGILEDLFAVILARLNSPLHLSNIQGDAFFAFSDDQTDGAPGRILDSVEALYFGFRERLTGIVDNTTCPCRACANAGALDLKFMVHHGRYAVQEISGRRELAGADVILLHRLMKTDVAERTGIPSYALFTAAAVAALDLQELNDGATAYATELEEFGRIEGAVLDMGGRWRRHHDANEIVVGDGELQFAPVTAHLPHPVEAVWEALFNPEIRDGWNTLVDGYHRAAGDPGRVGVGAVDHCAHGNQQIVIRFIDVRPLRLATTETPIPLGGHVRFTRRFEADDAGTRITVKVSRAVGPNPVATLILNFAGRLVFARKLRAECVEELRLLRDHLDETAGSAPTGTALTSDAIRAAARGLAAD